MPQAQGTPVCNISTRSTYRAVFFANTHVFLRVVFSSEDVQVQSNDGKAISQAAYVQNVLRGDIDISRNPHGICQLLPLVSAFSHWLISPLLFDSNLKR